MAQVYHVYLNNSLTNEETFISSEVANSPEEAKNQTVPKLKIRVSPNVPNSIYSLSAYSLQDDLTRNLGGDGKQITTTINIDQNPDYTIERETFSCALNSIITNIATALKKHPRLANCTIDVNKFIRCLSEILEHQKFPKHFEADLRLADGIFFSYPENRIGDIRERIEKFRRFYRIYLAFKYDMFKELRVPLKPKDANDEAQKVQDFNPEQIDTSYLDRIRFLLQQRINYFNNDRNITNAQQAIDSDPQIAGYRAIIAAEEKKIEDEYGNNCPDDEDCYVDISISPIFEDRKVHITRRKSNLVTISQSYLLTKVAKILKSGNSVPIILRAGPENQNAMNNEDNNIIIYDKVRGTTGPLHQVSIIGMSAFNGSSGDNYSVTLVIQDSYTIKGSEKKNIYSLVLTNSYLIEEIQTRPNDNEYRLGFDDGKTSNKNDQQFFGVFVAVIDSPNTPDCCVKS